MTTPHPLGVQLSYPAQSPRALLEAVSPKFHVEGLLKARAMTIEALEAIRVELKEGMTENEGRILALRVLADLGARKNWHRPNLRFGAGTTMTFNDPLQADYRLQAGDPYFLDLGPVWDDPELGLEYEGDYGDTFVFGGTNAAAERVALAARELFVEAQGEWRRSLLTGEGIYELLRRRAGERGLRLVEDVEGHRVSEFPHHKHTKQQLAKVVFTPSETLWVLEVQVADPATGIGAFFEDLL